ncbi:MAG: lipase maturation factor family protein [Candidatus Poribacteria bacterium]|nr:lipase maturation factor family protein [Candidatus Poribacteria bacterium]MDE0502576.1 lipase maturation factor family protein [Candidatus Poribacteria bacterium]
MNNPPSLPLVIYDAECDFCRFWIARWRHATSEHVDYISSQEVGERFPEIPNEHFQNAVQLVNPDGEVFCGAEAVFRAFAHSGRRLWPLGLYQRLPGFASVAERTYRFIAGHRGFFSTVTRWCWGRQPTRPTFFLTRWLFLRLLGVIYLVAFLSLWTQIDGLIGSDGILPAERYLTAIRDQVGLERYFAFPTLYWLNDSDASLHLLCGVGAFLSLLLIGGVAPVLALIGLWVSYLSLVTAGRSFLSFQWDALLLETGFLAIFFAPLRMLPRISREAEPSTVVLWLFRWLLFRLMFASGVVKLMSGDSTWSNLTALNFHYETQPLPTVLGWYAHHLPEWFQKFSVAGMFGIEIVVPFLIFAPRRPRILGAIVLAALQLLIAATGNYCFFNLLTIALCIFLLDDTALRRCIPTRIAKGLALPSTIDAAQQWKRLFIGALAAFILLVSGLRMAGTFLRQEGIPPVAQSVLQWVAPFRVVNSYGLFTVMTTSRPEIGVEGSDDRRTWKEYKFRWKPNELDRAPRWVAPHQPRLDWQMWFAALRGNCQNVPWFVNFMIRLLQGSPDVIELLEENPFPEAPPRYIRAVLYDYRFTDLGTKRENGTWWKRERRGLFCRPIELRAN